MDNAGLTPNPADLDAQDAFDENDPMNAHDDAVMAADDTGMISSERFITVAEIAEADPDLAPARDGEEAE